MASNTEANARQTLGELLASLDSSSRETLDTWLGKRVSRRADVVLPVRMRPLDESEKPEGPAFTARSRDVSEEGLGLTLPVEVDSRRLFQVEVFTEQGTWTGRMRLVHCTQTIGAYKAGMELADAADRAALQSAQDSAVTREHQTRTGDAQAAQSAETAEALTVEQAREEVRQAVGRYQLAEATWGLFGVQMDRELKRLLEQLPAAPQARIKLEPRRCAYRHEVQGQVHVLIFTDTGHQLLTTSIADISAGGARLLLPPPEAGNTPGDESARAPLTNARAAAIGLWTEEHGTLWLPARLVHTSSPLFDEKTVGLQFVHGQDCSVFR